MGATVYADLTNEEYRRTILGTRYDASVRLENVQREAPKISFQNVYIPKSVDWRQQVPNFLYNYYKIIIFLHMKLSLIH